MKLRFASRFTLVLALGIILGPPAARTDPPKDGEPETVKFAQLIDKIKDHGAVEHLSVMHGDAPDIDEFLQRLGVVYPRDEIVVADLGAVIGTHGGPRTMGITFHVPH